MSSKSAPGHSSADKNGAPHESPHARAQPFIGQDRRPRCLKRRGRRHFTNPVDLSPVSVYNGWIVPTGGSVL